MKKYYLLSSAFAVATISCWSSAANAQAADAPDAPAPAEGNQPGDIVVTGVRASLERAISIKRNSVAIVDAIAAEDVGKFPDTNIAESLQRIPGIAIDRNGGEGQFVTVRGFGPSFNTVLVNGRRVASENDTRAFSFDLFPADLIAGAEVYKTGTASLQAGGIGATINLKTARPLDKNGFRGLLNAEGLYDKNSGKVTPQFFGLISDTFADNRIGFLLSGTYQRRKSREEFLDQNGWLPTVIGQGVNASAIRENPGNVTTIFRPRETANGIREQDRERINVQSVLQFEASDSLRLTLDGVYNKFDVKSTARLLNTYIGVGASDITDIVLDRNGTVLKETVSSEIGSLVRLEGRPTKTLMGGFNADWDVTPTFNVNFDATFSRAKATPADSLNTGQAVIGFLSSQIPGGAAYDFDLTSGFPITRFNSALTNAIQNVDQYRLHVAQYGNQTGDGTGGANTDDKVTEFKLNTKWEPDNGGVFKTLRVGVSYEREKKVVDYIQPNFDAFCQFCGYFQDAPNNILSPLDLSDTLSGLPGGIQSRFFTFELTPLIDYLQSPAALSARDTALGLAPGTSAANLRNLVATQGGYVGVRQPSSFFVDEKAYSAYVDTNLGGDVFGGKWSANFGLRVVKTDTTAVGSSSTLLALGQTTPSQYSPTLGSAELVRQSNSYTKLLPTANLTFSPTDKFSARLAFSKTFSRPQLADLAPRFAFGDLRPGSLTASGGNTQLKPFTSTNFDASLEYYLDPLTFLTVAGFYKKISDFIITTNGVETITVPQGINVTVPDPAINPGANTVNFLVSRPSNAQKATVKGLEISAQVSLSFLPGFLSHLGVAGNLTIVSSNAKIGSSGDINTVFALPGLGNSQNASIFYDDGRLDARIAYSRRGAFLESLVNPKAGVEPVFVAPYEQVDFRVNYQLPILDDAVAIYVEGTNILNEKIRKHGRFEDQFITYRITGPRYSAGVRLKF